MSLIWRCPTHLACTNSHSSLRTFNMLLFSLPTCISWPWMDCSCIPCLPVTWKKLWIVINLNIRSFTYYHLLNMAYLHIATVYYYEAIINNNSDLIFTGAWSSTLDDTVRCDAWRDDELLSSGIYCKKHSTSASSGQSEKEESQTKVKEFRHELMPRKSRIGGKLTNHRTWENTV